jgi:hypothetical protein
MALHLEREVKVPIRVGILINSYALPRWARDTLEQILSAEFIELVAVVRNARPNTPATNAPWLWRALRALHLGLEAVLPRKLDAFTLIDTSELLKSIPMIEFDRGSTAGSKDLLSGLTKIRDTDLDVLLQFGFRDLEDEILDIPRYGVWRIQSNSDSDGDGRFIGFWPVYYRLSLARGLLLRINSKGVDDILADTSSATHPLSVTLTRSHLYWKASSLIFQTLKRLWLLGDARSNLLEPSEREKAEYRRKNFKDAPSSSQLFIYIVQFFFRATREYLSRRFVVPQWNILVGQDASFPPAFGKLKRLTPPPDRFWADPSIVIRNGRRFIFFEELRFGQPRACIAFARLDESNDISQSGKVLEAEYHLSFPFIFQDNGVLFMLPETREARSIKLFKCVEFPEKWEFVDNIMSDVYAVDSVIYRHDNKYWLFTTIFDHPGASSGELYVFYSPKLTGARWEYHPENPVRRGLIGSRSAGAIIERGSRLYRTGQDGAARYGHAIKIFEIRQLTETRYEEVEICSIKPDWESNVKAVHTLNEQGGYVVGDALFPRLRWSLWNGFKDQFH